MENDFAEYLDQEINKTNGEGFPEFTFKSLKLEDGKTIRVRILEKPIQKFQHYTDENRIVMCIGKGCPFCSRKQIRADYYWANVLDRADNTVKMLRFPRGLLKPLAALVKKEGDPRSCDISISRTGKKKGTSYVITRVENSEQVQRDSLRLYDPGKEMPLPSVEQM